MYKRVAADEYKSYETRRQALVNFFNEQQRLNQLNKKQQLTNPELKPGEAAVIQAQAKAKATQIERDRQQQLKELDRANAERIRAAALENQRLLIQGAADTAQAIVSNDKKDYADRIIAAESYYKSQRALIENQRDFDLKNEKLNDDEKKNIRSKANADLLKLQVDFGRQMEELIVSQLREQTQRRTDRRDTGTDEQIIALNDQFRRGIISTQEYERERERIEREGSIARLQILLDEANKTIQLYKDMGYDTTALEKNAADIRKQISDEETNHKIDNVKKLKDLKKQVEEETFNTVVSLVDSSFDREKNKIQDQIDALDKKKEKDLEVAEATITNEDKKQERISIINKRAEQEKAQLQARQKQFDIEKARFDKAANIAKITADTAAAIVAQIKATPPPYGTPFIAAVAAIGALQLARAIATPLPRYKHGTMNHPGGPAEVGDGGVREPIITPDGNVFLSPDRPTVLDLPKHSVVLSDTSKLMDYVAHTTNRNALAATSYRGNGPDIARMIARHFDKSSDKIVQAIIEKVENHLHIDEDGFCTWTQRGLEKRSYLNNENF